MKYIHLRHHSAAVTAFAALTCGLLAAVPAAAADDLPCVKNFTSKGNVLAGKKFDTWQDFPAVAAVDAFKRIYAAVIKEGWKISAADKELGSISATQEVSFSEGGKQVPMNILVEATAAGGSKVSMTFSLTGGVMGGTKTVQTGFCKFMAAVEPKAP